MYAMNATMVRLHELSHNIPLIIHRDKDLAKASDLLEEARSILQDTSPEQLEPYNSGIQTNWSISSPSGENTALQIPDADAKAQWLWRFERLQDMWDEAEQLFSDKSNLSDP